MIESKPFSNGETATVVDSDCVKTCSEDKNYLLDNKCLYGEK